MDVRQLAYVVAIARHRSFTRASNDLHVAQPALSAQVRRLELNLGVQLFERTTRSVRLTQQGRLFVERAEHILAEMDALERDMSEYSQGVRGHIRLGGWYTINPDLPELLAEFARLHPHVDITIREENSDDMVEILRAGGLDLALPVLCDGLDLTGIGYFIYRREPLVLLAPSESHLERSVKVNVRQLAELPLIAFKPGSSLRRLVDQCFSSAGLLARVAVETTQLSAAQAYVAAGLGFAIVPRSVAYAPDPRIAVFDLVKPPTRVSALAWSKTRRRTTATDAFIRVARRRFARTRGGTASLSPRLKDDVS